MPVKLHDFIHASEHGDDGIAGYLDPGVPSMDDPQRFLYWRSSNAMLPAFVNCLEGGGDMRRIYTNDEQVPWARPRGPGVKRRDVLQANDGDGGLMIEPVPMTARPWPARVVGTAGPAPLAGGLHAAALSAIRCTDTVSDCGEDEVPGLSRSLRHYALATRTLIALSSASGFAGVHDHVGAILVDDTGEILAAGINSGSYRHAEVSLLLSWFRDHPEARTLPARSIVFSTLTPCRQCTRYLSLAKAPDTLILFDEADAGRSGRVGERIASRFSPEVDEKQDSSAVGAQIARHVIPMGTGATREAERRAIRNDAPSGLSRMHRSAEAHRFLLQAADALNRITGNEANSHRQTDGGESRTEADVLAYLATWIRSAMNVAQAPLPHTVERSDPR